MRRSYPDGVGFAARELQRNQTLAEQKLWERLRNRQFAGVRFRRQAPFGKYILDFLCPERKMIIKVDGPIHEAQREKDAVRDAYFRDEGYTMLRFTNEEVFNNIDKVLEEISAAVVGDPIPGPSPA